MIILNLKANDKQQERIKDYLQENVSEILAEKINKGVRITKDGKSFISRKDLDGFMEYACKQAQEQAEKGKRSAMVEDEVVFGWAMHYFEEDSIEGTLYNPDGTPYEPPKPKYTPKPTATVTPPPKKDIQTDMFDLLSENKEEPEDDEGISEEEKREVFETLKEEDTEKANPSYLKYMETQNKYPENVVAMRLGDFYEIFGEKAVKIADILELTLTSRDFGLSERIPMIGFPCHAAEIYLRKIIDAGYKVAIIESMKNNVIEEKGMKIDADTGEILKTETDDLIPALKEIFGNTMEIRL